MGRLFGTAGIRKTYPDKVNAVLAYRLGLAAARLIGAPGYVVHDPRTTSPLLSLSLMAGLMAGGRDAYYIGLAPTPVAGYAALKRRGVGVSVTASHNPPVYNGFKFYDTGGYEFVRSLEAEIERLVEEAREEPWMNAGGFYTEPGIHEEYIYDAYARLEPSRRKWEPRIVVDLANGAAYNTTPRLLRMIGAVPVTVNANPDGFFPSRPPEPRRDVLEPLLPGYRGFSPDLILAHDGDADRLAALDPAKGFIRQDRLIAFYAALKLRDRRGGLIVTTVDTGRVIDDVVERMGGRVERYVLGKTHERVKELGASNILLAAEPWKLIDPEWGPWVDGIWQAGLIVREMVETGKPLLRLLEEYGVPDYPWERRSYLVEPVEKRDPVYRELVERLLEALGEPAEILSIDGRRYEYPDGSWLLVRRSGTEPKIRYYAEAPSRERLEEMTRVFEKLLRDTVKRHGARIAKTTYG